MHQTRGAGTATQKRTGEAVVLFSQKSDATASFLIFFSALAWSSLPLYGAFGDPGSVIALLFYAHVAALSFAIFAPRQIAVTLKQGLKQHAGLLTLATVLPFGTQAAFIAATFFVPATHATFVLELYPILMMILVPVVLKSQNLETPNSIRFVAFPLGAIGLLIIIASLSIENGVLATTDQIAKLLIGTLIALIAAFCSSLGVLKTKLAQDIFGDDLSAKGQIGVLVVTRGLPVPFLFTAAVYLDQPLTDPGVFIPGLTIGFTALALADLFGNHGLRLAKSVGPVLLFYYAPLLGAAWLVLFFDYPLPQGLLIGAMFIVVANAYSNLRLRRVSLVATLFVALAYALFSLSFSFDGLATGEALTLILVFFSIMAAAVQVRIHNRLSSLTAFICHISQRQGWHREERRFLDWAKAVELDETELLDLKLMARADRFFSDLLILTGLGGAVVASGILYGNVSIIQLVVSFSVVVSTVFVVASSIELRSERFILENANQVLDAQAPSHEVISFAFSIVVIVLILSAATTLG